MMTTYVTNAAMLSLLAYSLITVIIQKNTVRVSNIIFALHKQKITKIKTSFWPNGPKIQQTSGLATRPQTAVLSCCPPGHSSVTGRVEHAQK